MYKRILTLLALGAFCISLFAGCGSKAASEKAITVGVTPGPHAEIMEVAKKVAEKDGLKVKIVEFNDYIQPNVALQQGDIDLNSFQHEPYLKHIVKDRNYDLVAAAKTFVFPIGIYSKKIKSLSEISEGAVIAIPNDPTNGSRALLVLEQQGLIKLKPSKDAIVAVTDIIENPKNIKIKELDAAQIPRSLDDLTCAAINTNYAMSAGLNPAKDAIAKEDAQSPYANIIAVKTSNKDNPAIQKFIKAYQSDEVKKFVLEKYAGSVIPAW